MNEPEGTPAKKIYQLHSAPLSAPATSPGRYWALWKQVEHAKPGVNRFALTRKILGRVPKVTEMTGEQLAKMIRVFESILRQHSEKLSVPKAMVAGEIPAPEIPMTPPETASGPAHFPPPAMLSVRSECPTTDLDAQENSGSVGSNESLFAQTSEGGQRHETPAAETIHPERNRWTALKRRQWEAFQKLKAADPDLSDRAAARALQMPVKSFWSLKQYAARGFASHRANSGGKPEYLPTPDELAVVRGIYEKLDDSVARGRGQGSSRVAASRLAAKSDDPRISERFKAVVLNPDRKGKRVPPSWMRLLDTPASVLDAHRDKRSTMAAHVSTPRGRTLVTADGEEIPIRCGSIFESDDGTLNFYAWIPWPFGGDPCSEKFHVKLGRWQFLPVIDVCSEMCVAFDIVARNAGSYRGEDSRAIIGRVMFEVGSPEMWRLERGAWESAIVRDALKLCGVPVFNAWHSKQKSGIERFFDRLWTPASLIPGHVGRDRGRFKQVTDLAGACQAGRRDPRDHFLSLEAALPKVIKAVEFANTEPVVSKSGWGQWVPQERWQQQTVGQQSSTLDAGLKVFFSREQRVWTVRKGYVGGDVAGPQISFPVYFQTPELWEFEGCKVRSYFDPYTEPNLGTIVLEEEAWRSYRRGHVIARDVPALDLPPQAVLAKDWTDPERERQIAVRKAISKAVRTEMWNWLGDRSSRAADGLGNEATLTRRSDTPRAEPVALRPRTANAGSAPRPNPFASPTAEQLQRRRARLAEEAELAGELT